MALKGVKVIELAGLAPAPFCGMVLTDFGASVIRVGQINDDIISIDCLRNGKRALSLNLKNPKGISIFKKLSKKSDVLIEPFRKGTMENLGIGPEILCQENKRLIYARLSGFGQKGLYSERAGHDLNFLALSGLLSLFGRYRENPSFPVNLASDFGGGGLMCALGIILALYERSNSGLGQVVDCNMVAGTSYLGSWMYRSQTLPVWGNERGKNMLDGGAHFYEVYKTKDAKFVSVGAVESRFYNELLEGLGISEEDAPQFGDFDKLKEMFAKKFAEKTRDEWCEIFDNRDACVTPVLQLDEAATHPHNLSSFVKSDDAFAPKPAPKLGRTPGNTAAVLKAPREGEHTREILKEIGYTDNDVDDLETGGVIKCFRNAKL